MLAEGFKQLKIAVLLLLMLIIITGVIYPLIITGLAQICFPWKANGSLLEHDGKQIGSVLIGQAFSNSGYFWSRPSATTPFAYNAALSAGSNLGPTNPGFLETVKNRIKVLQQADENNYEKIPVDLVTTSGSGLDPDISPQAAFYQIPRIAKARGLSVTQLTQVVQQRIEDRQWGILGEPRVNVLELNLALDALSQRHFKK
jgi:K+-transporting ATPase ATPase C chain